MRTVAYCGYNMPLQSSIMVKEMSKHVKQQYPIHFTLYFCRMSAVYSKIPEIRTIFPIQNTQNNTPTYYFNISHPGKVTVSGKCSNHQKE